MIGAGDNSNHGFWLVTDCTKLPTKGMVGWGVSRSGKKYERQCTMYLHVFLGFNRLYQIGTKSYFNTETLSNHVKMVSKTNIVN